MSRQEIGKGCGYVLQYLPNCRCLLVAEPMTSSSNCRLYDLAVVFELYVRPRRVYDVVCDLSVRPIRPDDLVVKSSVHLCETFRLSLSDCLFVFVELMPFFCAFFSSSV